jgi:hypothetical protein
VSEVIERPATPPACGAETAQAVLDIINAYPRLHDQSYFQVPTMCGTTRCVAGWAIYLHHGDVYDRTWRDLRGQATDAIAASLLSLSEVDASCLFYGTTNDQAVAALRYLANGEAIDWKEVQR